MSNRHGIVQPKDIKRLKDNQMTNLLAIAGNYTILFLLVKRNFGQKLKFWSKIEILVKN